MTTAIDAAQYMVAPVKLRTIRMNITNVGWNLSPRRLQTEVRFGEVSSVNMESDKQAGVYSDREHYCVYALYERE